MTEWEPCLLLDEFNSAERVGFQQVTAFRQITYIQLIAEDTDVGKQLSGQIEDRDIDSFGKGFSKMQDVRCRIGIDP
jgi:hypothetical protein